VECLSAGELAQCIDGELGAARGSRVNRHLDECAECRTTLAHLARVLSSARGEDAPPAHPRPLTAGATLDRYTVLERVGSGAMGLVYSAFDRKLDRKVALKFLRARRRPDGPLPTRLAREAKALAKLSHPNVVAVYDVVVQDDSLFVAMEFVSGATLGRWLDERPRSTREILDAFVQAGRGLAAAHAVGIVHRDFKPNNVLRGEDGRVRVIDFGLAAVDALETEVSGERAAPNVSRQVDITRTGTILGTPAYMAPEQARGEVPDARSDQYSFCVALHEALFGVRPSRTHVPEDDAPAEPPVRRPVSSRVRRAIARGLSDDREGRHPVMDALLAELSKDSAGPWRRALRVLGVIALAAFAALAGAWTVRGPRVDGCARSAAMLDGAWDDARRNKAAAAFERIGSPFAKSEWRIIEHSLDRHAQQWAQARTEACEAVLARGGPDDVDSDPRVACLDDRLQDIRATADELTKTSGAAGVAQAVVAVLSLSPPESCSRTTHLVQRRSPSAQVGPIRADLASARVLSNLGRPLDAASAAVRAIQAAESANDHVLLAQALLQAGQAHTSTQNGDWALAEAELYRAIAVADADGDDATRAQSWASLIDLDGQLHATAGALETRRFFDQGMAAVRRLGGDPRIEAKLHKYLGGALLEQGDYESACSESRAAVSQFEQAGDALDMAGALGTLSQAETMRGDLDAGKRALKRVEEVYGALLGESHVLRGYVLNCAANLDIEREAFGDALGASQQALTIYEMTVGLDRLDAAVAMENMAEALVGLHRYEEALPPLANSLSTRRNIGALPARMAAPNSTLGRVYVELNEPLKAIPVLEQVVSSDAGDTEYLADAHFALARALTSLHRDPVRSITLATTARDLLNKLPKPTPLQASKRHQIELWLACASSSRPPNPQCLASGPARP
jgi:serine/threonine protein kinase/tetratricopeptide (TPR) repeat protein